MDASNLIDIAEHWGLLAGISAVVYFGYKTIRFLINSYKAAKGWVVSIVDDQMPEVIHKTLNNGIGQVIEDRMTKVLGQNATEHEVIKERINGLESKVNEMHGMLNRRNRGKK